MSLQWQASLDPPAPHIEQLAELNPANPFCTPQYAQAQRGMGERVCFLRLGTAGHLVAGCLGFIHGKFLRRRLQIVSLPVLPEGDIFWRGLQTSCRRWGIWQVQVDSYASPAADIPHLPGENKRRQRTEYILDLSASDPLSGASSNHRRNIARGISAQLSVRRTRAPEWCRTHLELMEASFRRRRQRGESVDFESDISSAVALLTSQAGEFFQALEGAQVVSSLLVLRSRTGAYYQSAGTSPRGMEVGASPFLISKVAGILQQEGVQVFNLGGAGPESSGLQRFKAGFGARKVELTAASFCPQAVLQRGFYAVLRALREKQRSLCKRVGSRVTAPSPAEKQVLAAGQKG
jgi:hypothetical protein